MKVTLLKVIFLSALTLIGCDNEDPSSSQRGQMKFSFSIVGNKHISLSSAVPKYALMTIINQRGQEVFNGQIDLAPDGDGFATAAIGSDVGDFTLTSFVILDKSGTAIYAAPKNKSSKAALVTQSLPIRFSVSAEGTTGVIPETTAVEAGYTQAEFGYEAAGFKIAAIQERPLKRLVYSKLLTSGYVPERTDVFHYVNDSLLTIKAIAGYEGAVRVDSTILEYNRKMLVRKTIIRPLSTKVHEYTYSDKQLTRITYYDLQADNSLKKTGHDDFLNSGSYVESWLVGNNGQEYTSAKRFVDRSEGNITRIGLYNQSNQAIDNTQYYYDEKPNPRKSVMGAFDNAFAQSKNNVTKTSAPGAEPGTTVVENYQYQYLKGLPTVVTYGSRKIEFFYY